MWEPRYLFRKTAAEKQGKEEEAQWSARIVEEAAPGTLARCDVGSGPNQSDNTFEILNSFLVN